jgi:NADPH:quinone reductase-like Zn-dependent oxidoreductase
MKMISSKEPRTHTRAYPNQRDNVITGHEFAGVVVASGQRKQQQQNVQIGQRVCAMHGMHGITEDGGYSTHAVVDDDLLVAVPSGVPLVAASFLHW